jgi:hypothetical protein
VKIYSKKADNIKKCCDTGQKWLSSQQHSTGSQQKHRVDGHFATLITLCSNTPKKVFLFEELQP